MTERGDAAAMRALVKALRRHPAGLGARGRPMPAYAGIGSRETPPEIRRLMSDLARVLADLGWTLRSGAAAGADSAFWGGALRRAWASIGAPEIYLPWPGFSGFQDEAARLIRPTDRAMEIAREHHPAWSRLSIAAQKLLGRNTHQVLGPDCQTPSKFLLCWTADGATDKTTPKTGGTGQALRVAAAHKRTAIYNLARQEHHELWLAALRKLQTKEPGDD